MRQITHTPGTRRPTARTSAPCSIYGSRLVRHVVGPSSGQMQCHAGCPVAARRQRHTTVAHAGSDNPLEGLVNSKLFQSDIVMKEFQSISTAVMDVARMSPRFPDFDIAGKHMYINMLEDVCERWEVFMKRLELSDEVGVKEYLRSTNAQMLNAGMSLPSMIAGMKNGVTDYRAMVQAEENAADPTAYLEFRKKFKASWDQSMPRFDFDYLNNVVDKQIIMRAQQDPQFWKALKEISENAHDPSVIRKWANDPGPIGALMMELWKSMQQGNWGSP